VEVGQWKVGQCQVQLRTLDVESPSIVQPRATSRFQHNRTRTIATMAQSDDEDDYMNMTFDEAPKGPQYETSLQRAARKRKEACAPRTTMVADKANVGC